MTTMSIRLVNVKVKKNHPNTLFFDFIKSDERFGNTYSLEYTGADVHSNELDEHAEKEIKKLLLPIYEYGPFDKKNVKQKFKETDNLLCW